MKKYKEVPYDIQIECKRLENQHKNSVYNYRNFIKEDNLDGAKQMLSLIRDAEHKLEGISETYSLGPLIKEFNPNQIK